MTPEELAYGLLRRPPQDLERMDHATLYASRAHLPSQFQSYIAPYEHRAFAREATFENPWMALPIAAGSIAYPFYKLFSPGRSAPSLDQVKQGLLGVRDGIGLLGR